MYGNNIGTPFMMPNTPNYMMRSAPIMNNMMPSPTIGPSLARNVPMMTGARNGLGSLLGFGRNIKGAKAFNFSSLLTNTSKALGVVKEAIPIVKEVGPMVGNMKQMLKIASIFKDETDIVPNSSTPNTSSFNITTEKKENDINETNIITNNQSNNNEPNFFL